MAAHARLKNEFTEDKKNHNLMACGSNDPNVSARHVWENNVDPDQRGRGSLIGVNTAILSTSLGHMSHVVRKPVFRVFGPGQDSNLSAQLQKLARGMKLPV